MPTRHAAAIALVAAALLGGLPRTTRAQSSTPPAVGDAAPKPKPAAAAPARFSVKDGNCRSFLALAPELRGLVVAWTAGRYHRLNRWVLDEATAHKVISGVEQVCEKDPDASFRYKVIGEIEKVR